MPPTPAQGPRGGPRPAGARGGRPCLARDDVARVIRDAQTGAIGAHEREVEPELLIGRAVVLGGTGPTDTASCGGPRGSRGPSSSSPLIAPSRTILNSMPPTSINAARVAASSQPRVAPPSAIATAACMAAWGAWRAISVVCGAARRYLKLLWENPICFSDRLTADHGMWLRAGSRARLGLWRHPLIVYIPTALMDPGGSFSQELGSGNWEKLLVV
jgi:hypothetical protein